MEPGDGDGLPPVQPVEEAAVENHAAEDVVQVPLGAEAVPDRSGGVPQLLPDCPQPVRQRGRGVGGEAFQDGRVLRQEHRGVIGQDPVRLPQGPGIRQAVHRLPAEFLPQQSGGAGQRREFRRPGQKGVRRSRQNPAGVAGMVRLPVRVEVLKQEICKVFH